MSTPEGGSRAPYIIICNGRIDLAAARNNIEMIQAASRAATSLVSYYGDKLTYTDTKPISKLQHEMMDLVTSSASDRMPQTHRSPDEMVDEMFALLDALEQKFP